MTLFKREYEDLVFGSPKRETRGAPKGKKDHEGEQMNFNVNYRPYGAREAPNSVTPGSQQGRMNNRYGKHERDTIPEDMTLLGSGLRGMFGR